MAARRGTARSFAPRGTRPATDWSRFVLLDTVIVAAGTKALLATFVLSNPGISETIRRTRGRLYVGSDQSAAFEGVSFALGFVRVTSFATAAGAASIPGPLTDANDDGWFVWEGLSAQMGQTGSAVGGIVLPFDSKAMRTVDEGFEIAVMVENGSGAFGLRVGLAVSALTSRR